jgi:hypothetical protein
MERPIAFAAHPQGNESRQLMDIRHAFRRAPRRLSHATRNVGAQIRPQAKGGFGSLASCSAIDGSPSTSAMPRYRPGWSRDGRMRANTNFASRYNLIWVVQSSREKYSVCAVGQITITTSPHSGPERGTLRDRHERWAGNAVDAMMSSDGRRQRGRRSRVVLAPRRWR